MTIPNSQAAAMTSHCTAVPIDLSLNRLIVCCRGSRSVWPRWADQKGLCSIWNRDQPLGMPPDFGFPIARQETRFPRLEAADQLQLAGPRGPTGCYRGLWISPNISSRHRQQPIPHYRARVLFCFPYCSSLAREKHDKKLQANLLINARKSEKISFKCDSLINLNISWIRLKVGTMIL